MQPLMNMKTLVLNSALLQGFFQANQACSHLLKEAFLGVSLMLVLSHSTGAMSLPWEGGIPKKELILCVVVRAVRPPDCG